MPREVALVAGRHVEEEQGLHSGLARERAWLGTMLNAGVWWIVPFAVSAVVIRTMALVAHLLEIWEAN